MSCSFNAEFGNVYTSINYLEGNFNSITGNVLYNYNELTQIISQQANVYNTVYYGSGNINALNANVTYDVNVNNLTNGNLLINNGNLIIGGSGGFGLSNTFGSSGQVIVSNGSSSGPIWASSLIRGIPITLSTSGSPVGTSASYTNIPPWVNQITITINGMSTNGTTVPNILLGTSAGYVSSGYSGCLGSDSNSEASSFSSSILLANNVASWNSARVEYTVVTLYHMGSNIWVFRVNIGFSDSASASTGNGTVTLPSILDRIQLTINGTQVFNTGSINIRYQ